ncbi:LapA family protein [Vibrio chagasii]|uniref:LapA family protein n=1 Tax=Vibrio chagasii TaxID=170679 RepID=UPI001EFC9A12|nr:lipopolysaccharide assembly protein LapA domain-containing protein [Vibrio chagasii]MCG9567549.1 lipopolysaccharide assembly protein LapA domain-containing protein [Vibrio chagasii]
MKIIKIVAVIVLFLIALALGSQNQTIVNFNYLLAQGDFHLSSLLGIVFISGFALAWLVFGNMHMRSQLKIHRLKKQLNKQSKQVAADTKA